MRDRLDELLDGSTPRVSPRGIVEPEIGRMLAATRPRIPRGIWAGLGVGAMVVGLAAGGVAIAGSHSRDPDSAATTKPFTVPTTSGIERTAEFEMMSHARVDPASPGASTYAETCIWNITLYAPDAMFPARTVAEAKVFLETSDFSDIEQDPAYVEIYKGNPPTSGTDDAALSLRRVVENAALGQALWERTLAHLKSKQLAMLTQWGSGPVSCEGDE